MVDLLTSVNLIWRPLQGHTQRFACCGSILSGWQYQLSKYNVISSCFLAFLDLIWFIFGSYFNEFSLFYDSLLGSLTLSLGFLVCQALCFSCALFLSLCTSYVELLLCHFFFSTRLMWTVVDSSPRLRICSASLPAWGLLSSLRAVLSSTSSASDF